MIFGFLISFRADAQGRRHGHHKHYYKEQRRAEKAYRHGYYKGARQAYRHHRPRYHSGYTYYPAPRPRRYYRKPHYGYYAPAPVPVPAPRPYLSGGISINIPLPPHPPLPPLP